MEAKNERVKKPTGCFVWHDYKLSIQLYFANFMPFFIMLLIGTGSFYLSRYIFSDFIYSLVMEKISIADRFQYGYYILSALRVPAECVLFGFFGAAMGFAYDIMSSGDGFTQPKNILFYIRKFWGKFFLLSLVNNIFIYLLRFSNQQTFSIEIVITGYILSMIWYLFLVEASPSLVANGRIISACRESFKMYLSSKFFWRITCIFGLFYFVFVIPFSILNICLRFHLIIPSMSADILQFYIDLCYTVYIFIGFPLTAFLSTGIYNEYRYQQKPTMNESE